MVIAAPKRPINLATFYLDTGDFNVAGRTLPFKGTDYVRGLITAGTIERGISLPPGPMQLPDATLELDDVDGTIKAWFDEVTPLRRLVKIIPELMSHDEDVTDDNVAFTGEVTSFDCPEGIVSVTLSSIFKAWMNRPIPHLITRDNFPNLPDDLGSAFASIIYGRVYSYTTTNVQAQGAMPCPLIDTTTNDYCVARHPCYAIPAVYRKHPLDQRFTLVDSSEYSLHIYDVTIYGVDYHFQTIRFIAQQYDGTKIRCDVSGASSRYDFSGAVQIDNTEVRNPVDAIVNLIYLQLQNEVNIERFDSVSALETRLRCSTRNYYIDGAITGKDNTLEVITAGNEIGKICSDFNIDFIPAVDGTIKFKLFDLTEDGPLAIPLNDDIILKKSFSTASAPKVINHFRYRYFRQYAGLPEELQDRVNRDYAFEFSIRNVTDQDELSSTGANPRLDKDFELNFVRDDATAIDVIKRKIPYHAIRSYPINYRVGLWQGGSFTASNLDLGQAVLATTRWVIGDGGWTDKLCRVNRATIDLMTHELTGSAIAYWPVSDGDLDIEFSTHPARDVQVRKPQFPVTVNGATPLTATKSIDLRHDGTIPSLQIPVYWVEDTVTDPTQRRVTGYVAAGETPELTDLVICAHASGSFSFGTSIYGTISDGCLQDIHVAIQDVLDAIDDCVHYTGTIGVGEVTNDFTDECVQAVVDAIQDALDSLDSRIDTVSTDLASFESSVATEFATVEGDIAGLTSSVGTLTSYVTSLAFDVASLDGHVGDLQTTVTILTTNFNSLLDCLSFYGIEC